MIATHHLIGMRPAESAGQVADRVPQTVGGHPHLHGRPVSWVLVSVIIAAFVAGAFAVTTHTWWLFWVCLGVTVLSVPVGKFVRIMDDTVLAGDPSQQEGQGGPVADDAAPAVHPGADVSPTRAVDS